jgi:3-oxoacyl-[acyl-carrier-protein] synthase-3
MDGVEVYKFAVKAMADVSRKVMAAVDKDVSEIDLFVPHQANRRIIHATARSLGIPDSRVFSNVERYGNMSAASLPVALCEAVEEGRIKGGDHVVLVGAGAGLSWGAILLRWQAKLESN